MMMHALIVLTAKGTRWHSYKTEALRKTWRSPRPHGAGKAATNDDGATRIPCKTARLRAADDAARLPGMPRRRLR